MKYKFVWNALVGCDEYDNQCLENTNYESKWYNSLEELKKELFRFNPYTVFRYAGMIHPPIIYDNDGKEIEVIYFSPDHYDNFPR